MKLVIFDFGRILRITQCSLSILTNCHHLTELLEMKITRITRDDQNRMINTNSVRQRRLYIA